jgi:hypothetical protein
LPLLASKKGRFAPSSFMVDILAFHVQLQKHWNRDVPQSLDLAASAINSTERP